MVRRLTGFTGPAATARLLLEWLCKAVCVLLLLKFVLNLPIFLGMYIADGPVPGHPGHMGYAGPSLIEVASEIILIPATFFLARWLIKDRQRRARRRDGIN